MHGTTKHSGKSKGLGRTAPRDHLQTHTFQPALEKGSDPEVSTQAPPGPPRKVLTPEDIEVIYNIPRSTQAKGRMTGDTYPFIKRGRSVLAFSDDVEAWLRGKLRRSTSDQGQHAAA